MPKLIALFIDVDAPIVNQPIPRNGWTDDVKHQIIEKLDRAGIPRNTPLYEITAAPGRLRYCTIDPKRLHWWWQKYY